MLKFRILLMVVLGMAYGHAPADSNAGSTSYARAPVLFNSSAKIRSPVKISPQMIPVCYNFGCRVKEYVSLTDDDWSTVEVIFKPQTGSPDVERIRVAKAVAQMEKLIGKYTPIHRDIGYNLGQDAQFPGQLDCIDESINTTTYLHILERYKLIKHHKVIKRAYRRAAFDQHWTGQIEQLDTGERYVIDTWFYANGEMPVVQSTEQWLDISIFTSYTNNAEKPEQPKQPSTLSEKVSNKVKGLFN